MNGSALFLSPSLSPAVRPLSQGAPARRALSLSPSSIPFLTPFLSLALALSEGAPARRARGAPPTGRDPANSNPLLLQ